MARRSFSSTLPACTSLIVVGRKMMVEVREAMEGCELILLIMDATAKFDPRDELCHTDGQKYPVFEPISSSTRSIC